MIAAIVVAYWLLAYMRRHARRRWFPLAGSAVAFATIFAFVLAADYLTDYFDPFQWGLAVVAVLGIAATLLAYLAVERYIVRRLPQRRVRHRQCPFCGYPVSSERPLRGLRTAGRRAVCELRGSAASRHRALRDLRRDELALPCAAASAA